MEKKKKKRKKRKEIHAHSGEHKVTHPTPQRPQSWSLVVAIVNSVFSIVPQIFYTFGSIYSFITEFFFVFLGLHLLHMEVPRLGLESEL